MISIYKINYLILLLYFSTNYYGPLYRRILIKGLLWFVLKFLWFKGLKYLEQNKTKL